MKARCDYVGNSSYRWYGAKGITYNPEWVNFETFQRDMQEGYNNTLSLERIDNHKGYSKENCKWIPLKDQAKNTRHIENARRLTYQGETLTIREWADKLGIKRRTLGMRVEKYNWPLERVFSKGVVSYP